MEVIVVDDGTPYLFNEKTLGDGDPRLRAISLPSNRGAATARQAGAEAAKGEFLAFLDADDIWFPDKLEKQLSFLHTHNDNDGPKAVACGWVTSTGPSGLQKARIPIPSASALDFLSGCWFCPGSTLLLSRETFFLVGSFDARLSRLEDLDWSIRFALAGGRLLVAPIVGASIRPSGRVRFDQVEASARIIAERYTADPRLSLSGRRRLMAYLALEKGAAARAEDAYPRALLYLMRSLILKPRLSLPLRRWWHN